MKIAVAHGQGHCGPLLDTMAVATLPFRCWRERPSLDGSLPRQQVLSINAQRPVT
jgi:hypothetical protein